MLSGFKGLTIAGLFVAIAAGTGCTQDKPHEHSRGLQGKDVVAASDQMAMDLLALPELNASKDRWLIVVDHIDNMTADSRGDLDIFLQRLSTKLAIEGHGRVQLVENRAKFQELQSRELTPTGNGDSFGQGGGGTPAPGSAGFNPDYYLDGKIMELPNRRNSYYLCEFSLVDFRTRLIVWTNQYEVNTHR